MAKAATAKQLSLVLVMTAALAVAAAPGWTQYWGQQDKSSLGASFAYGGNDKGGRLEFISDRAVWDAGYFDVDGDDVYALELGYRGGGDFGFEGEMPWVLGGGYYRLKPEVGDEQDKWGIWVGLGNFSPQQKGFFYQLRYIFNGPIEGTQGIFGYRFK
jgi:hypothetical protein